MVVPLVIVGSSRNLLSDSSIPLFRTFWIRNSISFADIFFQFVARLSGGQNQSTKSMAIFNKNYSFRKRNITLSSLSTYKSRCVWPFLEWSIGFYGFGGNRLFYFKLAIFTVTRPILNILASGDYIFPDCRRIPFGTKFCDCECTKTINKFV